MSSILNFFRRQLGKNSSTSKSQANVGVVATTDDALPMRDDSIEKATELLSNMSIEATSSVEKSDASLPSPSPSRVVERSTDSSHVTSDKQSATESLASAALASAVVGAVATAPPRPSLAGGQTLPPPPSAALASRLTARRTNLTRPGIAAPIAGIPTAGASSVADVHGESAFEDRDMSSVRIRSREHGYATYTVVPPPIKNRSAEVLVHYFYEPFPAATATLESIIRNMLESATSEQAFFGLDSETGSRGNIDLLQFSTENACVLIHRRSMLFRSDILRQFFSNTLDGWTDKAVFCGAELAGDALDMLIINQDKKGMSLPLELHGALDFTPLYTNMFASSSRDDPDKSLAFTVVKPPVVQKCIGLRPTFEKVFKTRWTKDSSITCSDWSKAGLTLGQVKYGALDAWVSCKLGLFALQFGVLRPDTLFTTVSLSYREPLVSLFQQSKLLDDMKEPKAVLISNMQKNKTDPRMLDLHCIQYANHIRGGPFSPSKVLIKLYSPGGSKEGVVLMATPEKSVGKVSTVEPDGTIQKLGTFNAADWKTYNLLLQRGVVDEVVRLWTEEDELCGRYTKRTHIPQSTKVRVRVYFDDKDRDIQLAQVSDSIKFIVRSHYWKSACNTSAIVKSFGNALGMSLVLDGSLSDNTAVIPLSDEGRECIQSHEPSMTPAQYQALCNSFEHKISVIQGPAGTGKTRVIAAIADVATSMNKRVLIIAPGNAASRRILESICSTGFEDACLIVAEEFFLEWHELSYHKSYEQFVYTKDRLDEASSSRPKGSGKVTARDRGHHDFRERKTKRHVGKYDPQVADGPMPEVVIATQGLIATTLVQGFDIKKGGWQSNVKKLVDFASIDMVIIDESSQLWSGYLLGWFSALKNLQSLVIVGDEKQLPPFGQEQVSGMKSLLSEALTATPPVPDTLLDVTWRLPSCIAEFISSNVYDNQLRSERYIDSDAKFCTCLQGVVHLISNPVMRELSERFLTLNGESGSMVWLNHQFPAHVNKETKSTGNVCEAAVVSMLASSVIRACDAQATSKHLHVVILTPYLEQKIVLENQLAKDLDGFRGMDQVQLVDWVSSSLIVNTVDSFQGQEAEFVFVSLTRSCAPDSEASGLGFAKDSRRANVMLTRVKNMMVVVGDAINMVSSSKGKSGILIPLLAQHSSDTNSMFLVSKKTDLISPYKLPLDIPHVQKKRRNVATKPAPPARLVTKPLPVLVPSAPTSDLTSFWSTARRLVRERGGVTLLSQLGESIPPAMRPAKYKNLLLPLSKDPLLCIAEGEDNQYIVVLKEVIDKFSEHIIALLKNSPSPTLLIRFIEENTNRKSLGVPSKNVLSIDTVVSLLSPVIFAKGNSGSISLRNLPSPLTQSPLLTSTAQLAQVRNNIKEYLTTRPGCTATFNEVAKFKPSSLSLKLKKILSEDHRFVVSHVKGSKFHTVTLLTEKNTECLNMIKSHIIASGGGPVLLSSLGGLTPKAIGVPLRVLLSMSPGFALIKGAGGGSVRLQ